MEEVLTQVLAQAPARDADGSLWTLPSPSATAAPREEEVVAAVAAAAAEAKVAKWLQQPLMQLAGGQVAAATPW